MEVFGGFVVMMSIISFFLAVVWLVMPFVAFAIMKKQHRMLDLLENVDKRLAVIEACLESAQTAGYSGNQGAEHTEGAGEQTCAELPVGQGEGGREQCC